MNIAPAQVAGLFEQFNPGASAPARFQRILDADFEHPSWELVSNGGLSSDTSGCTK
jgi:3-hydroxyisobutyrate dehydrogenase